MIRWILAASLVGSLATTTLEATAEPLYAFTTSTLGSGDLHSWVEVVDSYLAGLDAADGICAARANAAGLPSPDEFVAWLSDANDDAYCRVFGLHGKTITHCGLLALPLPLPVGAGPWLRTDGMPFAATIERVTIDNVVYAPLNVDESGNPVDGAPIQSYTATSRLGEFDTKSLGSDSGDCGAWTSASDSLSAILGNNSATGEAWTSSDSGSGCGSPHHLMCLQKGSAPGLTGYSQFGRREAFVTSADLDGALGGIAGADGVCQSLAAAAKLYQPESFKALITSFASGANVIDRFVYDGAWYRRDGLPFAFNKAELVSGEVTLPLNVTESGAYLGFSLAMTGAREDGAAAGLDCSDWISAQSALATGGLVNFVGHHWLSNADVGCAGAQPPGDWPSKLLCLSDSDVLFHDEFEALPAAL
jgi:hypothetical protein